MNEIELRVVEALLNKPELADSTFINYEWFEDIRLRNIVEAIQKLEVQERTLFNIYSEMVNDGSIEYKHLVDLQGQFVTDANFDNDVKSLHKMYAQRNLELSMDVYKQSPRKQELTNLSEAISELSKIDEEDDNGELDGAIEELQERLATN